MRRRCSTYSAQHFEQNSVAKRVGYKISKSQVPQVPFFNQEPKKFLLLSHGIYFLSTKSNPPPNQNVTKTLCQEIQLSN